MALDEFSIITQFFSTATDSKDGVSLGIGDDAAILRPTAGHELVVSTDTMVVDVHFLADTPAVDLGYKSLAVNLSDLAAMGARPRWATLALSLPRVDATWLADFARGLGDLANQHQVALVGGDTTKGTLSITLQIIGEVPYNTALKRSTATPGDLVYVTGTLGDAGLALLSLQEEVRLVKAEKELVLARLNRPQPRVAIGLALRGVAHAAIDVSDGLAADLTHILDASGVGATLWVERLPLSPVVRTHLDLAGGWSLPLTAGDDYELCFTVAERHQVQLEQALQDCGVGYTWIGTIDRRPGLRCLQDDGTDITPSTIGYRHF